jgi:hypothetical protein
VAVHYVRLELGEECSIQRQLYHEECADIEAYIRKRYRPPLWMLKGEEWEALGRPRSGAAYEKHEKKWARIMRMSKGD